MSLFKSGSLLPQLLDLLDGMQNRGVMLAPEGPSDLGQRGRRKLFNQVHRDLAGIGDHCVIGLLLELRRLQCVVLRPPL